MMTDRISTGMRITAAVLVFLSLFAAGNAFSASESDPVTTLTPAPALIPADTGGSAQIPFGFSLPADEICEMAEKLYHDAIAWDILHKQNRFPERRLLRIRLYRQQNCPQNKSGCKDPSLEQFLQWLFRKTVHKWRNR